MVGIKVHKQVIIRSVENSQCCFHPISAQTTPPPQYFMPVPVRAIPISIIVTDVTRGGKIFLMVFLGSRERNASSKPHTITVPSILRKDIEIIERLVCKIKQINAALDSTYFPKATFPSMPSFFICEIAISKIGRKVKDVPMTDRTPEPKNNFL